MTVTTADAWMEEGLAALELARGADHQSELIGDYELAVACKGWTPTDSSQF